MAIERLRSLRGERETLFCEANSPHVWQDLHAFDSAITADEQALERKEHQLRITQWAGLVHGRKSASKLAFALYLASHGTPLATGASAYASDSLGDLLADSLGGSVVGGGSVTTATGTTTILPIAHADIGRFGPGRAVMVDLPTGHEVSVVDRLSGDNLCLAYALSAAPDAAVRIWNSRTCYLDTSSPKSWQFQLAGEATTDEYLALGCAGGFTLANLLQGNEPAAVHLDMMVTDWIKAASSGLHSGTFDGADPLPTAEEFELLFPVWSATTRTRIAASTLEIVPGHSFTQLFARGNGDHQHVDRLTPTKIETTAHLVVDESATVWADWDNGVSRKLLATFGTTPGSTWAIELPYCTVRQVPKRAAHAEQIAADFNLRAYEQPTNLASPAVATSTAIQRSPFRIHRL